MHEPTASVLPVELECALRFAGQFLSWSAMDHRVIAVWESIRGRFAALASEHIEPDMQRPLTRFVQFWIFVGRSFVRNRCPVRATALAYTTLLALVPLLAVSLGVSTSLLKSDQEQTRHLIEEVIGQLAPQLDQLPGSEIEKLEARQRVIEHVQNFIANIHSGALGVTGTAALVLVAIGLLSTIEASFNDIWGVLRGRSWISRVVNYWTAITLVPLIVLLATGLAVSAQFMSGSSGVMGRLLAKVAPFLILSVTFGLLYQLMPNTKVEWRAALIGGLVGALLWMLNGSFNVGFASRVVSASRIYGPLGVVPVFLIGMYISWIILLFGAQVTYAYQHRHAYLQEKRNERLSVRGREFVALRLMLVAADRFRRGVTPASVAELAAELGVPPRLVTNLVDPLRRGGLLIEVNAPTLAFTPSRPIEHIALAEIIEALRSGASPVLPVRADPACAVVEQAYRSVVRAEQAAAAGVTLRDLLDRSAPEKPSPKTTPGEQPAG